MKTENDMLKKLVQDELEKEAEQIKREMEQEPKLSEGVPSPEMKSTIWRRAEEIRRQKEAYDNLSEADKEALRLGREFQLRREEKVVQQIEDEFGYEVVNLGYQPEKMKMVDYVLEAEFLTTTIYYKYGDNIFTYVISPVYQNFSFGFAIEDKVIDEYEKVVGDTKIQVTEYLIVESNQQEFSAKFEYEDIAYILTGIIEKSEFEKILENLHFF